MWHCWIYGIVEWNEIVKLDNTTEFVTLLDKRVCWKRWEYKTRKTVDFVAPLNIWNCWIRYYVNEIILLNVLHCWILLGLLNEIWLLKQIMQLNLWHCWMCWTVEWDENVKSDYRTEFVTMLKKCDCWKGWECNTR